MSRYDYRDPGTDPAYCDGLSEPEETIACSWCGDAVPLADWDGTFDPYCSSRCAIHAEHDSEER